MPNESSRAVASSRFIMPRADYAVFSNAYRLSHSFLVDANFRPPFNSPHGTAAAISSGAIP